MRLSFVAICCLAATLQAAPLALTAEIRNEQPYSLDGSAIRVRIFNHRSDTLRAMSFCYRFYADKEFVFESDWYLPGLDYAVDTLSDTTYQIHFWLKRDAAVPPGGYFPNESGIVYRYWFPWNHLKDYSYSSSPVFESSDKLFLSETNECAADEIDSVRIKILGVDFNDNGVRDDLDSLIDARLSAPEMWAAYRYLAQAIQNQWKAFYENPKMTYEELHPYEVLVSLGISLIDESGAEAYLNFQLFNAILMNSLNRLLFDDKIDRVFAGKSLPVAVKSDKRYAEKVVDGLKIYGEILNAERAK